MKKRGAVGVTIILAKSPFLLRSNYCVAVGTFLLQKKLKKK